MFCSTLLPRVKRVFSLTLRFAVTLSLERPPSHALKGKIKLDFVWRIMSIKRLTFNVVSYKIILDVGTRPAYYLP